MAEHLFHISNISLQGYTLAGAAAFVLTAIHIVMRFLVYLTMIISGNKVRRKRVLMLAYFTVGLVTHVGWLVYLWPSGDLYILIALGLTLVSDGVFVMACGLSGQD